MQQGKNICGWIFPNQQNRRISGDEATDTSAREDVRETQGEKNMGVTWSIWLREAKVGFITLCWFVAALIISDCTKDLLSTSGSPREVP